MTSPHDDMREQGYVIVTEEDLGLPGFRHAVLEHAYRPDVLIPEPDVAGPVPDRYRIKDMIHYTWNGDGLLLAETGDDRFARLGTGTHIRPARRFHWLQIPGAFAMTCQMLRLVPPEMRHPSGTFGVHAIRSFNDVVSGPHQDGFEYGVTYVLDRAGDGAVSYLYRSSDSKILDHQLQPGEILLFRDAAFLHGATALEGDPATRHRDALIIQFDAPEDLEAAAEELSL